MVEKLDVEQVLKDWSYWQAQPNLGIPRDALLKPLHLDPDLVLVVQGVRRCGKSTLLAQIMDRLKLNPQECTFVNFEDPRLSDHLDHTLLDAIVAFAESRHPGRKLYFFFDEIQNVSHWQKWIHRKLERPGHSHFVITGSNASLLSGELASALTGRHTTIELFPFDFFEYQKSKPKSDIENYLADGGFPRAMSYPEPQTLLREYFTDIIERDVRSHVAARSTLVLTQLVKAVFESMGSEVSFRNLATMLGVSTDTVKTYLDACESAYLLLPCQYFTFSERQRAVRNKKYYPIDLGLRKSVITKTGKDRGKDLEAVVFHHLRKRFGRVFYWRQAGEMDFVVQNGQDIVGFQVSWDGLKERHLTAAAEFREAFPQTREIVSVTRDTIVSFLQTV